jgi:GAF domain-containing protein
MDALSELQIVHSALDRALRITDQTLGNVQLVDWRAGHLQIAAQFSAEFLDCFRYVTIRDGSACGRALLLRDSVVIHDVGSDHRFSAFREVAGNAGFSAVQSTPLMTTNGVLIGIISTHGRVSPNRHQLEQIKTLAQDTAERLIRYRARIGGYL